MAAPVVRMPPRPMPISEARPPVRIGRIIGVWVRRRVVVRVRIIIARWGRWWRRRSVGFVWRRRGIIVEICSASAVRRPAENSA